MTSDRIEAIVARHASYYVVENNRFRIQKDTDGPTKVESKIDEKHLTMNGRSCF